VACAGAQPAAANQPILVPGQTIAPSAFPLSEAVATMTATINDTSVVINTDTVLKEVLRLTDYKDNRISRTCPTMLDRYANYNDAYGSVNSPLSSFQEMTTIDNAPNGAWLIQFCDPNTGAVLSGDSSYTYPVGGTVVQYRDGIPVRTPTGTAEPASYPLMVRIPSTEKLVLSPFIFANACEWETGLFGINNIQLVLNFKSNPGRSLRFATNDAGGARTISNLAYANVGNGPWYGNSRVQVQYLTPSLDIPLPAKSVVPYMEFPRYLQQYSAQGIPVNGSKVINSQTIVLPQIPDMLIIYAKPTAVAVNDADYYYPIDQISLNFDNFAGLLSSHTQQQLYSMAVHNGLEMNIEQWGRGGDMGHAYAWEGGSRC
jgi:hypothetical protein